MALFKVLLIDTASVWLDSLPSEISTDWGRLKAEFETRYNPPGFMKYQHANDLFNTKQGDMSVDDFCAKMQRLAKDVGADENMLRFAVINGLNVDIRNHVTRNQPTTWTDLLYHARVGEMSVPVHSETDATLAVKLELIQDQLKQLTVEKIQPRAVSPVIAVTDRRPISPLPRRVRFEDQRAGSPGERRSRFDEYRDTDGGYYGRRYDNRFDANRSYRGNDNGFPRRQWRANNSSRPRGGMGRGTFRGVFRGRGQPPRTETANGR